MLCVVNKGTDPYFNLAAEEYFFHHFSDDIFMLWQNQQSIIIGKHQNTLSEINYQYVKKNNIAVVRRLSGGGTVYHDTGNLNFTFIQNARKEFPVDFKNFTQPILDVLHKLGVDARHGLKNDLLIGEKKISGNAEHIFKNRILHHGTLLFSSRLKDLNEAIHTNPEKYLDKAVKSRRSTVTNISDHLKQPMSISEFSQHILNHIFTISTNAVMYDLKENDIQSIKDLSVNKYQSWEWNYGYSPSYQISKSSDDTEVKVTVEKGIITEALIKLNGTDEQISGLLINLPHKEETIREVLFLHHVYISDIEKIINQLF